MEQLFFSSLLDALEYFKNHEEYVSFNLHSEGLQNPTNKTEYAFDSIQFLKTFKFEDDSDSDSVSLLHLVETRDHIKGFFIDASGAYAALNFIKKK